MNPYSQGWKAVESGVDAEFDVESTPLEIKTNSEIGSDKMLRVWFETTEGSYAGGVRVSFTPTPQYYLPTCMAEFADFPADLPSSKDMVWRITVNRTSEDVQLLLHCNGQEVLNVQLSEICTRKRWRTNWARASSLIKFSQHDTASVQFRPYTPGRKICCNNTCCTCMYHVCKLQEQLRFFKKPLFDMFGNLFLYNHDEFVIVFSSDNFTFNSV